MNNFKENKPSLNRLVKKSATKEKILLLFPLVAVTTTAIMLILATSITSANTVFGQTNSTAQQQQQSTSSNTSDKSGIITSVQTDAQGKWNLNGTWSLKGANSGSPTFTSEFSMAKLDGSSKHKHNISDFKMAGKPATDSSGTIYTGTATITMKEEPATNVPVTILISNNGAFSIKVDQKATADHFGNTPIMGKVTGA
jgi:cell division protein FtsL